MTPEQRFRAARWGYVAVVLLATLTQLHFSSDLTAAGERLVRAFTPSLGWRDAIDGLRNTVLFAGLGAVWVVSSRSGNVRAEIRRSTLVGLALSATVEGLQVFSPVRWPPRAPQRRARGGGTDLVRLAAAGRPAAVRAGRISVRHAAAREGA